MVSVGREGQEAAGPESSRHGEPGRFAYQASGSCGHVEAFGEAPHEPGGRQVRGRSSHLVVPQACSAYWGLQAWYGGLAVQPTGGCCQGIIACPAGVRFALPNGTVYKTTAFTTPLPFMENGNIADRECVLRSCTLGFTTMSRTAVSRL